jgi:hypothetical protein
MTALQKLLLQDVVLWALIAAGPVMGIGGFTITTQIVFATLIGLGLTTGLAMHTTKAEAIGPELLVTLYRPRGYRWYTVASTVVEAFALAYTGHGVLAAGWLLALGAIVSGKAAARAKWEAYCAAQEA